jgi:GntR family transcriptional regulator
VGGFREQIAAGVLLPGDKLPSVRELAGNLTINPNTIQRAYRELEAAGWIATVAGKGCFVCGVPGDMPDPALAEFDALVASLLAKGITPDTLIRRITEGGNNHA